MKLVKRSGYYYMRLRRGGVEEWISTHKTSERAAQKSAERILMLFDQEKQMRTLTKQLCRYAVALAKGEIEHKDLINPLAMLEKQAMQKAIEVIADVFPAPPITAEDMWERYVETSKNIKKQTFETKKQRWQNFAKWIGDTDMRSLNEIICRSYLDSLNITPLTRNNYIASLSTIFEANNIENPWGKSLRTSVSSETIKERKTITIEQARMILAYCDNNSRVKIAKILLSDWANFLRVLYYSGLRPVDVANLKRSEINNGVIELLPEKTSRTRRKVSYKADKKMLAVLDKIEDDNTGYYFIEFAKKYKSYPSFLAIGFNKILEKARLDNAEITLYSFRHNYVTYQIDSGNDNEKVASAVGHFSTTTTKEHYYHGRQKIELSEMPEI